MSKNSAATGTVYNNSIPCLGDGPEGVKTVQVKIGDVVNITFPGSPPFRIARTGAMRPPNSTSKFTNLYCGYSNDPNITTNTFTWTVEPYMFTGGENKTLGDVGSSVMFAAIEYGPESGIYQHNYYASSNYSIVSEISAAEPVLRPSAVKSGMVLALLVMPALLSVIF